MNANWTNRGSTGVRRRLAVHVSPKCNPVLLDRVVICVTQVLCASADAQTCERRRIGQLFATKSILIIILFSAQRISGGKTA